MKYSATLNKNINVNNFYQSILFFAERFLNAHDFAEGEKWLHDFGGYMQNSDFPCTKINIDPFCKYQNMFSLTLYYRDTRVLWMEIEVSNQKYMRVHKYTYLKKDFEMFHCIITGYFRKLNTETWNTIIKTDKGKTGKTERTDTTRHRSGTFWRFQPPQVTTFCSTFIQQYERTFPESEHLTNVLVD